MNPRKSLRTLSTTMALACGLGLAMAGCNEDTAGTNTPGTGGSNGSGGKGGTGGGAGGTSSASGGSTSVTSTATGGSATGGSTSSGGSGGSTSTGGGGGRDSGVGGSSGGSSGRDSGVGGSTATGGSVNPDGAVGGSTGTGGSTATGGATGTGGATKADGAAGADGAAKSDGATGAGGVTADSGSGGTGGTSAGYCPATEPCRISPLGDSITEGMGWNYPSGGGYRSKLFSLVLKDAKNVTFVGTRSNGPSTVDGKTFPKNHEGTSGITIQDLQKNVVDKGALTGAAVKPHIILLHIGTNNLSGGNVTTNINYLGSLIDAVVKACPDALLVVAKIIPFNGSEKGFNDAIPALLDTKTKAGAHIIMVDQSAGFLSSDIGDGVHPNEAGYIKMAAVWYKAISQYLK